MIGRLVGVSVELVLGFIVNIGVLCHNSAERIDIGDLTEVRASPENRCGLFVVALGQDDMHKVRLQRLVPPNSHRVLGILGGQLITAQRNDPSSNDFPAYLSASRTNMIILNIKLNFVNQEHWRYTYLVQSHQRK